MSRPNTPQTFQLAIQRNPEATKHRSCQSYVLLLLIVAIIVWWSVEAIVMPMSHREGAAVLPTTVTLVTITPAAVVATTMPTPTPTRVRDAEPSAISNATTTFCVHHAPYLCDNRGTDVCRWTTSELTEACGLTNFTNQAADTKMSPLAQALSNRRIVFHGDSTLREVFSAVVDAAAASAPAWNIKSRLAVDKRLTNMSSRAVIGRRLHTSANDTVDFSFRFDYTIDHLNETIPDVEPSEGASLTSTSPTPGSPPPDAVVVGLGLYHARSIHRNTSIFVNMTTGQTTFRWGNPVPRDVVIRDAAASIQSLVCDRYGAKVGFFASTWLECGPLKPKKIKSATPPRPKHNNNYFDCTREHGHLRAIQHAIQEQLMAMPPRADGCAVHYVHPIKCTSQSKHACLFDGIHTRPGGHYAQSKGQVLLNSMITSWNHMA